VKNKDNVMKYNLAIIGGGPAGYVAAIRAGQMGLKTVLIEQAKMGGMCLHWGCIPSKALIESAKLYKRIGAAKTFGITGIDPKGMSFDWAAGVQRAARISTRLQKGIEGLLKKNGVEVIAEKASIESATTIKAGKNVIEAEYIAIATGSRPEKVAYKTSKIIEIDDLFAQTEVPQNIAIIGKSPTALELAQMFNMVGKKVSLLVRDDNFLPMLDNHLSDFALKQLKKNRIAVLFDVKEIEDTADGIKVNNTDIKADIVINSEMRKGVIPENKVGLKEESGFLLCDEHFATSTGNIFAIGDVNGLKPLAHAASAMGINVANQVNGVKEILELDKIPINIYSFPEITQVGLTEERIKASGIAYKDSLFPMSANGKAMTEGQSEGFVRILSETRYGEVLGVQIVADNATDLVAEATAILQMEGTVFDIGKVVHAHPTVSEIFMEAGMAGADKAIHI
jgi:dihydrolipoamide dehydrogenase